jgi:hypothetical protein
MASKTQYASEGEAFAAGRSIGLTWDATWVPGGPWDGRGCPCEICEKDRRHAEAWMRGWHEGKTTQKSK